MVDAWKSKNYYLVFISYSTKDRWIARQLARHIESNGRKLGITTFLDEKDIDVGDPIHEAIRKNLQKCSEFVVLLSRYSVTRPWVLIEIGGAFALGKRIVAVTDKVTPKEMPEITIPYKAVDINNFDEYLQQLVRRVRGKRKRK